MQLLQHKQNMKQNGHIAIYETEHGRIKVEVQVSDETVWLSLNQIAKVFERDKSVISKHLKNIFTEGELEQDSTVANFATVQVEGSREVERQVEYYNLDAILSVGYRVNSRQGVQFRRWASNILKEYLIKGHSINQDKITQEKLNQLQQTVELLSNTLINQHLVSDTGRELISLIKSYAKTWHILIKYDEEKLTVPISLSDIGSNILDYNEILAAIFNFKQELQQEAGNLFGLEHNTTLKGIVGNLDQTFSGESLYKSAEEKAAHLLYFIIKDHPFTDGNKRIGSLLFLLYLSKVGINISKINPNSMTALALLIAESDPNQKEIMIKLIINLIIDDLV